MPRNLSYKGLPVSYKVVVGNIDITNYKISVNIDTSLDVDLITEYKVNDATITVNNEEGIFSQKEGNFFETNGFNRSGYNVPVTIEGGFEKENGDIEEEEIFTGRIAVVREHISRKTVRLEIEDLSSSLFDAKITDFGLQKYGLVEEDPEQSQEGITAVFPFSSLLSPVSDDSVSGEGLTYKSELDTEGALDPSNFTYNEERLETEGGPPENPVIISGRSPHRYKSINFIVRSILNHYNIQNSRISIPNQRINVPHFSSNGRLLYETENSRSGNTDPIRIKRFVTDMVYNSVSRKFYYLAGHRDPGIRPQLLEKNNNTDVNNILYEHTRGEFWQIATEGFSTFYILGTTGQPDDDPNADDPTFGWRNRYYDASFASTTVFIWSWDGTNLSELIGPGDTYRPQLGSILQLGLNDDIPIGAFPSVPDTDSRRMILVGGSLYYVYANELNAGIAKRVLATGATSSLFEIDNDKRGNLAAISFIIEESTGYGFVRFINDTGSRYEVFRFNA